MVSTLLLDVADTHNLKTIRINDSSFYNPSLDVECGLLEVTPPGHNKSVNFNVTEGFSIVLNSSNLKLHRARSYRDLQALPDGIYKIKYSINPNEQSWVEYDYFRVNKILKDYNSLLCQVKLQTCTPDEKTKVAIDRLIETRLYIDYAKAQAEDCGNRDSAIELYNYAKELINKGTCFTCK